ncbi:hypothetical protein BGX34_002419 [Mortierella sp. NVP85]|nr:hypothetical protein BGX34_002419 [Mortierella sp. NVP85]
MATFTRGPTRWDAPRPASSSSSSAPPPHSRYYNEATKTFYPTTPIRTISPGYMDKAKEVPETMSEPQKLLVILDLNGTLFYRAKRNNRAVTSRPYLTQFLNFIFANCHVMVWSSAQPHSVEAMLNFGFGDRASELVRVWNRTHFKLPKVDYERKVLTIKDLEFVWDAFGTDGSTTTTTTTASTETTSTITVATATTATTSASGRDKVNPIQFDQTNTVLIDDSTDKIQLQPYNGLTLRDFDENLAKAGTDDELLQVKSYLEKLIYQKNVSAYMRLHPFSSNAPLDSYTVKKASGSELPKKVDDDLADELDDLARRLEKSRV